MIEQYQNGNKIYSDGMQAELEMLKIAEAFPEDLAQDFIAKDSRYTVNNTFSSVRQNILNWYPFKKGSSVLEIGAGMGAITGMLCDKCESVTAIEMSEVRSDIIRTRYGKRTNLKIISQNVNNWNTTERFDYVIFIGVLEYAALFSDSQNPFEEFLASAKRLLKNDGIILFAIENRFGLRYWCGASEDHLQTPFVGLEGYLEPKTARTFSKVELQKILDNIGLKAQRFYYVLPDYKFPQAIYTDEYLPNAQELQKMPFTYGRNSKLLFDEKILYEDIIQNGRFDFFANSYLVEASMASLPKEHIIRVSGRGESKKEYRITTTIDNQGNVVKTAAHPLALAHLMRTYENGQYLKKRDISVIDYHFKNNKLHSKVFTGRKADDVFISFLKANDFEAAYRLIDKLKDCLQKSSEPASAEENIINQISLSEKSYNYGIILKDGFVDMTFYNSFYEAGELIFFDQEWRFPNLPLNFILYYSIKSSYLSYKGNLQVKLESLLDYLEIKDERQVYDKLEDYIWSLVLYRQGDFYGADGYCNQYREEMKYSRFVEDLEKMHDKETEDLKLEMHTLRETLINKDNRINLLEKLEKEHFIELEQYRAELANKEKQYNIDLSNKNGHIELLLESERELERIKNSRSWRFMSYVWKMRDFLAPHGSKRRLAVKLSVKFVKMPEKVIRKCTPSRINKFFYYLRREGVSGVSRRLDECITGDTHFEPIVVQEVPIQKSIEEYDKIIFPVADPDPKVSIVIPVYNQFNYTYECLKSIVQNTFDVSYEIVLADDCSTDITQNIGEIVENLKVVKTAGNLGFLRNCKNAAKHCRGEYIFFLNNDTQVQDGWLTFLVDLMDNDEKIGLAGSKLVYPDGSLQEAGGIVWNDATAWNYGRLSDPNEPEFNYVKEVDYISGAAIMIRRKLWEEIGGFDERFIPAYCEDSDLAFEVRKHGFKVVYQPKSVVVHFEGKTNGTDIGGGQKQYQAINQQRFYEKWKKVLNDEHCPNGSDVFLCRDKSRMKKLILIIDHYVPHFDKDAGSRTVYQYIKLFVDQGFNVKFIGDNFYKHEPYTGELQNLGVEVLYGSYYADNWKKWIRDNGDHIDFILLNRPHISVKYIDYVKTYTNAKVFYYGHDLHFLREMREYKLTGDNELLKSSEDWAVKEMQLITKADCAYYPSQVEVDEVLKRNPGVNIKGIPAYLYDHVEEIDRDFNQRKEIIFVGGFGHRPNVDAVLWLAREIMPMLAEHDLRVTIIGSNAPDEILKLNSKNLFIKGFVSDEELRNYYNNSRLVVVPLRYGAGIKGKVIEAMYYGVPIITTSVGAEGLKDIENLVEVKDEPIEFAKTINSLYNNTEKLRKLSEGYPAYIKRHFSKEAALKAIGKDFGMKFSDGSETIG